jgi:hypothetical protein
MMKTSTHSNKDVQTHIAEVMEAITDMLQWGGEFSFIDETRYCCNQLVYNLKSESEYLSFLIECQHPPETTFNIYGDDMNRWAN